MRDLYRLFYISIAVSLLLALIQELCYDSLVESNKKLTLILQNYSTPALDLIFKTFGQFTNHIFLFIGPIDYVLMNKERGLYSSLGIYTSVVVFSVLKMMLGHPRPIWINPEIRAISCGSLWGSPSGHAMMGGAFIFFYSYFFRKTGWYALLAASLALDRVYLGAHSYIQMLFGFSFAAVIALAMLIGYENKWIQRSLINKHQTYGILWKVLGMYLLIFILCFFAQSPWNPNWNVIFYEKCKFEIDHHKMNFNAFMGTTYIWFCLALIFGYDRGFAKVSIFLVLGICASMIVLELLAFKYLMYTGLYVTVSVFRTICGYSLSLLANSVEKRELFKNHRE